MTTPFLTAKWSNLCLMTYEVPPEKLAPYLSEDLEPDERNGKAFVSLVAFDFLDTRVKGIAWPFFRNFPEVNLRAYCRVKHGLPRAGERGVCFVREFVPSRTVAWIARTIYNEPYARAEMSSSVTECESDLQVRHEFSYGGSPQRISVMTEGATPNLPEVTSFECFLIDQEWGFGRTRGGRSLRYRVTHPRWLTYRVRSWSLELDWGATYGPQWGFLLDRSPCSVLLAKGSEVEVFEAEPL